MDVARDATLERLPRLLPGLGDDWKQFSPYFLAFKHGGLVINRDDVAFVDDHVTAVTDATVRHQPSLAVWTRAGRKQELQADFHLNAAEVCEYVSTGGRIAIEMCADFIASRLATIDALEFSDDGEVIGLWTVQLPWTTWLREKDLDASHWELLGAGPRITWATGREGSR